MSKPVQDVARPPLTQVLNTLPSPLTVSLVGLGPALGRVRRVLEILSWKSSWEESWLALSFWWVVCLCSDIVLRYGLPVLACGLVITSRWIRTPDPSIPTDEDTLHQVIVDLTIVRQLLPCLPQNIISTENLTILTVVRTIGIIYVPYLLLTYFVRLRILLAIAGTVLFTWRARWALLIRRALWRSAYIRWGVYHLTSRITGLPLPSRITPSDTTLTTTASERPSTSSSPANSIRFLFSVYENQRWWMGLDFTAALLPGERPSWCTSNQQPVSPPAVFTLPASTTVYLPDPARKDGKIKRMARWTWEEPEWKVVVRKEGSPSARVERPLPTMQDENTASASASRILKAAGKMRQASISGDLSPERQRREANGGDGDGGELLNKDGERGDDAVQAEPYTDADGWVYCDNKWENGSAKGGIGKYTRYRRWTRVAVLNETVEHVDASSVDLAMRIEQSPSTPTRPLPAVVPGAKGIASELHAPLAPAISPVSVGTHDSPSVTSPAEDDRSRLRNRLKAAVRGGSIG